MAIDYTYIVARLRAIESYQPDKAWFQRLARTSEGGLLGTVREYYRGFESVDSLFEFENGIESEKSTALEMVSALIPDRTVTTFLRAGYDFDNLLHAWKAHRLGRTPTFNRFGLVDPGIIEKALTGGDRGLLPEYLKRLLDEISSLGDSMEPAVVEYAGESAKWRFLLDAAPGREALHYTRTRVDLINIKSFVRLKRTPIRRDSLERVWIDGGLINAGRLSSLLREPEEALYQHLGATDYRALLRRGFEKDVPLWKVDPILRSEMLGQISESRYRFFDLSPVLYHIEVRERDWQLLRQIIVGRVNRLPGEIIEERIEQLLAH